MPWPVLGIVGLVKTIVGGVKDHYEGKRKVKAAVVENKIRLAQSQQSHNHDWEMRQLDNVGWKDDVLFYAFIAMFVWSGFDPEGARQFFENLKVMPEWFIKTWFWLVASVVGVKKIGDYLPSFANGLKDAFKKNPVEVNIIE